MWHERGAATSDMWQRIHFADRDFGYIYIYIYIYNAYIYIYIYIHRDIGRVVGIISSRVRARARAFARSLARSHTRTRRSVTFPWPAYWTAVPRLEPWEHTTSTTHPPLLRQNSTFSFSSFSLPLLLSSHIGPAVPVPLLSAKSSSPLSLSLPRILGSPRSPSLPASPHALVPFFIPLSRLLLTRSRSLARTRTHILRTRARAHTRYPLLIPCLSLCLSLSICPSVLSVPPWGITPARNGRRVSSSSPAARRPLSLSLSLSRPSRRFISLRRLYPPSRYFPVAGTLPPVPPRPLPRLSCLSLCGPRESFLPLTRSTSPPSFPLVFLPCHRARISARARSSMLVADLCLLFVFSSPCLLPRANLPHAPGFRRSFSIARDYPRTIVSEILLVMGHERRSGWGKDGEGMDEKLGSIEA